MVVFATKLRDFPCGEIKIFVECRLAPHESGGGREDGWKEEENDRDASGEEGGGRGDGGDGMGGGRGGEDREGGGRRGVAHQEELAARVTDTIGWDIWEGATTRMVSLINSNPLLARGGRVIELGAGVGLVNPKP